MAGVIVGLLTPARPWFGENGFLSAIQDAMAEIARRAQRAEHRPEDLVGPLRSIGTARREALAPVVRIQSALHHWVAFGVMPLFALANAGVRFASLELGDRAIQFASAGIIAGLVLGKPIGILAASFIAVRAGLSALPRGIGWPAIAVLGCVGGIGFTMAIFMAELAFSGSATLDGAKLAVLVGSVLSGVGGLFLGRVFLPSTRDPPAVRTAADAEASTER
jgi:NhaA family Na+:H+ antiporter